jgi:hypothetical protein
MKLKNIAHSKKFRWVLLAACLMALTGCIVEPPRAVIVRPAPEPVVVESNLIYYPDYEVYYDPGVRVFWYRDGAIWVRGARPPGIAVDVILHSRSVPMDFRGSPALHHDEVRRLYPRR